MDAGLGAESLISPPQRLRQAIPCQGAFDLPARLAQLRQDQDAALDRLRAALHTPRRVVDVFEALFKRPIGESDAAQLSLATGEAVACLNYLIERGEARREVKGGLGWYALV